MLVEAVVRQFYSGHLRANSKIHHLNNTTNPDGVNRMCNQPRIYRYILWIIAHITIFGATIHSKYLICLLINERIHSYLISVLWSPTSKWTKQCVPLPYNVWSISFYFIFHRAQENIKFPFCSAAHRILILFHFVRSFVPMLAVSYPIFYTIVWAPHRACTALCSNLLLSFQSNAYFTCRYRSPHTDASAFVGHMVNGWLVSACVRVKPTAQMPKAKRMNTKLATTPITEPKQTIVSVVSCRTATEQNWIISRKFMSEYLKVTSRSFKNYKLLLLVFTLTLPRS